MFFRRKIFLVKRAKIGGHHTYLFDKQINPCLSC